MNTLLIIIAVTFVVALAAIAFGIYKGMTAKKLEADIKADLDKWLGDILVAKNSSEAGVKAHFEATEAKIKSFFVKYFKL